jgi:HD-like signal output (HDOD) protein
MVGWETGMANLSMVPTYRSGKRSVAATDGVAPPETRGSALELLQTLAAELSRGIIDLPGFPEVVVRIRDALADSSTTPQQIVRIVGAEPRLSAKLLQTANSVAFNSSGKALTELRSAITRLGHQLVQSAALAFAVEQMKNEKSLHAVAKQMSDLWMRSISVASICQVVARRTKVNPDEAFLTGLLHGIGRLYILVRVVGKSQDLCNDPIFMELVAGWHASIGKMVLENWGFAEEISGAINDQADYQRKPGRAADLTDVLIASIALADGLERAPPHTVYVNSTSSLQSIGISEEDRATILMHAEYQLASLHEALGC